MEVKERNTSGSRRGKEEGRGSRYIDANSTTASRGANGSEKIQKEIIKAPKPITLKAFVS